MSSLPDEIHDAIQSILEALSGKEDQLPVARDRLRKILTRQPESLPALFRSLAQVLPQLEEEFLDILARETTNCLQHTGYRLQDDALDFIEEALLKSSADGKWQWLILLAFIQSASSLDIFVRELIESTAVESSPPDPSRVLQAFAPLMQRPEFDPDWLFPALFDGINHSVLSPVIFDFANFCFRNELGDCHPAEQRKTEFMGLLDQLAGRMLEIDSDPTAWSSDPLQVSRMISDSVAIMVALCDTMALLNLQESVEVLKRVNRIRHRRIRAESTFALAKLGVESGQKELLELAREPVSRLRVLRYAQELGVEDQVDQEYQTDVALAESEVALWLSQPNQMGVPPSSIEFLDQRTLFWPGFDDPVECFLFRYAYQRGDNVYSNVAIAGPLVHSFIANLEDLESDDLYSVFAGWQCEHEDIFELDMSSLSPHRKTDLFKLERRLHDYGASEIETGILAVFFGEILAVARCQVEDQACVAFVDGNSVRAFEVRSEPPINEEIIYCLYKGAKLIDAFNSEP